MLSPSNAGRSHPRWRAFGRYVFEGLIACGAAACGCVPPWTEPDRPDLDWARLEAEFDHTPEDDTNYR